MSYTAKLVDQRIIVRNRIVAVLIVDEVSNAVPVAQALIAGGIESIELTLRTDVAVEAIAAIKRQVPEMTVGAGTVIFPDQVQQVRDAGADFAVSPGLSVAVAERAIAAGLPFAPGVATPSDVEGAIALGFRVLKFYPAESMGGLAYLTAMSAPYHHLGLTFVPLGGVGMDNLKVYLECPLVAAVGGSWIAKRELIQARDWGRITANARAAVELATGTRRV